MSYATVQSRSVYLHHQARFVRLATMKFPPSEMEDLQRSPNLDDRLAHVLQFIAGVPPQHFLSFSMWHQIADAILSRLNDPDFRVEMRRTLGGSDRERSDEFDAELAIFTSIVTHTKERMPDRHAFANCTIRNLIMNDVAPTLWSISPFVVHADYRLSRSLLHTLYWDLKQFDALTLQLWNSITFAALGVGVSPAAKRDFDNLLAFHISFSGSPKIISMTVEDAVKYLRGAGNFIHRWCLWWRRQFGCG